MKNEKIAKPHVRIGVSGLCAGAKKVWSGAKKVGFGAKEVGLAVTLWWDSDFADNRGAFDLEFVVDVFINNPPTKAC